MFCYNIYSSYIHNKGGVFLNQRIKELRKKLGLSQDEFGRRLGVTRGAITNIELNKTEPKDLFLNLICDVFDVNEEWLRTGNGEMFIEIDKENQLMMWAADVLKDESDSFRRRFVKMLSQLGEEDWKTLERMAIMLHSEHEEN